MEKQRILVVGKDLSAYNSIKKYVQGEDIDICCIDSSTEALESFIKQDCSLIIVDIPHETPQDAELICMMGAIKDIPILVFVPPMELGGSFSIFRHGAYTLGEESSSKCAYRTWANGTIQTHSNTRPELNRKNILLFGNELLIRPHYRQVFVDGDLVSLTKKEFDLLYHLARHPGQVFSREQLYAYIWNDISEVDGNETVKTHIKNLRKKLALAGKKYIHNVWGVGYKFAISSDEAQ